MTKQRRSRWTGVRLVAVLAVTTLALGRLFAGAAWAPPPDSPTVTVSGVPACNGDVYEIFWAVSQGDPNSGWELGNAGFTPPGGAQTNVINAFSPRTKLEATDVSSGVTTAPGSSVGVAKLDVEVYLTGYVGPPSYLGSGSVTLDGSCGAQAAPSPTLQVGPSAAAPGEAVTISGTACLITNQATAFGFAQPGGTVTGSVAFTPPLAFGPITAAADGTWSTSIVVPTGTPPGNYAVSASCAFPELENRADGSNAAIFDGVSASAHGQAQAGFAYETKYLTVALVAVPRTTG